MLAILYTLVQMVRAARARGELGLAGELWGAVRREGEGHASWDETRHSDDLLLEEDHPDFLASVERGRTLDLTEAVAIALDAPPQTVP